MKPTSKKQYLFKEKTATIVTEKEIKDKFNVTTKNEQGRSLLEYLLNAEIGERFNNNILRVD